MSYDINIMLFVCLFVCFILDSILVEGKHGHYHVYLSKLLQYYILSGKDYCPFLNLTDNDGATVTVIQPSGVFGDYLSDTIYPEFGIPLGSASFNELYVSVWLIRRY